MIMALCRDTKKIVLGAFVVEFWLVIFVALCEIGAWLFLSL